VRDFGDISDREALVLQGAENLHRRDQTPGETAYTFWLLRKEGFSGVEIARTYTQKESYVSYMTKVGEALDRFAPHERLALSRPGVLQVRQSQAIAPLATVEARVEALARSSPNHRHGAARSRIRTTRTGGRTTMRPTTPMASRPSVPPRPWNGRAYAAPRSSRRPSTRRPRARVARSGCGGSATS
jgi:hypothetical protein